MRQPLATISCPVTLLGKTRMPADLSPLGGPLDFRITITDELDVPNVPDSSDPKTHLRVQDNLIISRVPAQLAIHKVFDKEGQIGDVYLLASVPVATERPPVWHNEMVYRYESEIGTRGVVEWFGEPANSQVAWSRRDGSPPVLKSVTVSITQAHMADLWAREGPPDAEGSWLATRLLPHVTPGALRINTHNSLHLFAQL